MFRLLLKRGVERNFLHGFIVDEFGAEGVLAIGQVDSRLFADAGGLAAPPAD